MFIDSHCHLLDAPLDKKIDALMQAVQRDVRTLFAVDLLPEPVFPGRKSPA